MNVQYHVNQHVMKMPIETTQMLSTVLRERFQMDVPEEGTGKIYRSAYVTHPCTRWTGASLENFVWMWFFGVALCDEFKYRYGKEHATRQVLSTIRKIMPHETQWHGSYLMTDRPKCVAPEFKEFDVITAYRLQYVTKKTRLFNWTNREVPPFVQDQSWKEELVR
jgi:hypothetical protein